MRRPSPASWLPPLLWLLAWSPVLPAQEPAEAPAPKPAALAKPKGQEAVQAALKKQAVVATERQGALVLRDLGKHCGVPAPVLAQLKPALDRAIVQWVDSHPPEVYGNYEPDFRALLRLPAFAEAFERLTTPAARAAWQELDDGRRQRLVETTAAFVAAEVACELRLAPAQVQAIAPLCRRIAEQSLEFRVYARPSQLVRELDRNEPRALSTVQHDLAEQLNNRGGSRDAGVEFVLEAERLRLLCGLDETRAHLLRACGRSQGRRVVAELQARQKAAAAAAARPEGADADPDADAPAPGRRAVGPLGDDSCLVDPFWAKVRDSVLTAEDRQRLQASPPVGLAAVGAARTAMAVAMLDHLFHLDPEQRQAVLPLAQKVAEQDLKSYRITSLDVAHGFGLGAGQQDSTPEERGNKKALEDLLDRPQFEVLKDKVGI